MRSNWIELQREAFRAHIALAKELNLPMQIHDRDSHKEVIETLLADGAPWMTFWPRCPRRSTTNLPTMVNRAKTASSAVAAVTVTEIATTAMIAMTAATAAKDAAVCPDGNEKSFGAVIKSCTASLTSNGLVLANRFFKIPLHTMTSMHNAAAKIGRASCRERVSSPV